MTKVYTDLWVGSQYALLSHDMTDWAIIHAAKEPFHRQLLGYKTPGAPKNDPEYLYARRGDQLYLNLVDTADPKYIDQKLIDVTLAFIDEELEKHKRVFIHCNQGLSRAPSIALLYLVKKGVLTGTPSEIRSAFEELYPDYQPATGMYKYVQSVLEAL